MSSLARASRASLHKSGRHLLPIFKDNLKRFIGGEPLRNRRQQRLGLLSGVGAF